MLTEYRYTVAGRLWEIRTQEGFRASYGYDADGNRFRLRIGNEKDGFYGLWSERKPDGRTRECLEMEMLVHIWSNYNR